MQVHVELSQIAEELADRLGLALAYDTHHDAGNFELYWWQGNTRHAIDLQPYPDGTLEVRHRCTHFPWPSRLINWARSAIPMFPALGVTDSRTLGSLSGPYSASQVAELVHPALPPN